MEQSADTVPAEDQGKRARAKAANRTAILQAGRQVFATVGFEACTVRDIIRETRLASGTFYNYFKSKEDVFDAIAEDSAARFRVRLGPVRESATGLKSYVAAAYTAYFNFVLEQSMSGTGHRLDGFAVLPARSDTPEMTAIAAEIAEDLARFSRREGWGGLDDAYFAGAAIGIARELADVMLKRDHPDPDATARFAAKLLLNGALSLSDGPGIEGGD